MTQYDGWQPNERAGTIEPPAPHTCGECIHHSRADRCCNLNGESKRAKDAACGQGSDGTVTWRRGEVGELEGE